MGKKMETPRFYSISDYLKSNFGCKMVKLALDGGFTCPNRDGSLSYEGCIFCSADGSGDFASDIPSQIKLLSSKWPNSKYIAYFQSHTNTYAPPEVLREKFYEALSYPDVKGLAIATRPDCLPQDVLSLLDELNQKTFLWVELGLQTIHAETASIINRCYSLPVFDDAMTQLSDLNIKTVVHLILGLPGESKAQMEASLRYVCSKKPFGIKLHLLNVVKGSSMEKLYPEYVPFSCLEEYVTLIADLLEIIPPEITLHRLTADAPRALLISPEWSYKKRTILNGINAELKKRGSHQGCRL